MGKNKNKAKREETPEVKQTERSVEHQSVEDDDEWQMPGGKGTVSLPKPVTRADTKAQSEAPVQEPAQQGKGSKGKGKAEEKKATPAPEPVKAKEEPKGKGKGKAEEKKATPEPEPVKAKEEPKGKGKKETVPEPKKDDKKKTDNAKSKKEETASPEKATKGGKAAQTGKQAKAQEQSNSRTETSPPARRDRKVDSSPSPDPVYRNYKQETPSPKKGKAEPERKIKDRKKGDKDADAIEGVVDWFKTNWKLALIIGLCLTLFIWVKLKEDTFNRLSINTSEQLNVDLYEVLGLSSSASADDIKKAYKNKANELHPDKNPDCVDCQEKFNLVTKAYETLNNPETRTFYDTTAGVISPLKSSTHSLTLNNYHRLVEESNDVWIILVYLDTDEVSSQFINFWDEAAKEYPFVQFGRINYATQAKLISRLPFRVDEVPFVLSVSPDKDSEFFEFNSNQDIGPQLRKFVKDTIGKQYTEKAVEEIKQLVTSPQTDQASIVHITRNFVPTTYSYLAHKFHNLANFFVSKSGDHKRVYSYMEQPQIDYIVKLPAGLQVKNKKVVSFRFGTESKPAKEVEHLSIFPFVKFLFIPEVRRSSFNEFCSDYSTSEDSQSIKPSVCVIALKGSDTEGYNRFIELFKSEQKSLLPTFFDKVSEKNQDIFDAVKSVQFAWLDVNANKKFRSLVEKSDVKNPRAMIFVSSLNKIKFYNDVDSLADDLEEVTKGSYPEFKHLIEMTNSEEPLNSLLLPDNASILRVFLRSVVGWFTSIFALALGGAFVFGLNRFSNLKYHIAGLIIAGMYLAVGLFEGIVNSNRLGLL